MKKFVIERNLPGAQDLSPEELQTLSRNWTEAALLVGKPHIWVKSFIGVDKIYCVHLAESEAMVREHARIAQFTVNIISEIRTIIDPTTGSLPFTGWYNH